VFHYDCKINPDAWKRKIIYLKNVFFQCFDPTSCSSLKDDDHVGPAAQQMSKRGPIFVVDNSDALETSHDDSLPLPTVTIGELSEKKYLKSVQTCDYIKEAPGRHVNLKTPRGPQN